MIADRLLDLSRIDVLAARLDQLLRGGAAGVEQIALGLEAAHVAGVMPTIAERHLVVLLATPIAAEHHGAAHNDFTDLAGPDRLIQIVDDRDHVERRRPPRRARLLAPARQ